MIYIDTSAVTKLLIAEPETPELRTWLTTQNDQGEYAATSALSRVELMRVVARYGEPGQAERARYLLDGLDILPITEPVI
ncbi:type II toxin-antitoxin system VapC family toxin, partial [Mycobacterium timonense]